MKVLFVPVSAARGLGEYARALTIARAVQHRWPDAQLHFVLSTHAPYATQCPYPATLLPGSATLHTPQVVALLKSYRPDIAIFDNAGRTVQIRAAQLVGARVVYISSRRRQRAKAFRLSWMRRLSEHWIAYPAFIAGELGWIERAKLRMLGRPRVRFADVVLPPAGEGAHGPTQGLDDFVLVVPGGGTAHPGASDAPQIVAAAAEGLLQRGLRTVLVGVADAGGESQLIRLPLLPQAQLVDLMRRARVVLSNGGDTLLQALACSCACVAVPIAHDQSERIERCRARGLIHAAPLAAVPMIDAVAALYADEPERLRLTARGRTDGVRDALPQVLDWIAALAGGTPP